MLREQVLKSWKNYKQKLILSSRKLVEAINCDEKQLETIISATHSPSLKALLTEYQKEKFWWDKWINDNETKWFHFGVSDLFLYQQVEKDSEHTFEIKTKALPPIIIKGSNPKALRGCKGFFRQFYKHYRDK